MEISTESTSSQISCAGSFNESNSSVKSGKSQAIPLNLINEEWQIILSSDSTALELQNAIIKCKELVLSSLEVSEERKWLVRHLVEMRLALRSLEEDQLEKEKTQAKVVLGHHFSLRPRGKSFQIPLPSCVPLLPVIGLGNQNIFCDQCTGMIWTVLQDSFECADCGYLVHQKCIDSVLRVCAHVIVSDMNFPISDICPEVGLHIQKYKCRECGSAFLESSSSEPRLCDYDGCFYCQNCHWGDSSVVPARIIHNWDFKTYKVSRPSLQQINLFLDKPNISLEESNPKLFVFLSKLTSIKKLREDLVIMKRYLVECRDAIKTKLIDKNVKDRRHLIQSAEFYSINDLMQVENDALHEFLYKIFNEFDDHIRSCNICCGKGYICEICDNNEVLYPYEDGAVPCGKCNSIYHRVCWSRKNENCPKCKRIEDRLTKTQVEVASEAF